jgi:hypothetical protein
MCFTLYLAANKAIPIVPWDENTRHLHTETVDADDRRLSGQFKYPNVCYVGSDTHCGCGFRNATFQNGSWPEEEWHPEEDTRHIDAQPNHQQLVSFIEANFSDQSSVELYGLWEGLSEGSAVSDQTISLDRLLDLDFYFRERGHYSVTLNGDVQDTAANR